LAIIRGWDHLAEHALAALILGRCHLGQRAAAEEIVRAKRNTRARAQRPFEGVPMLGRRFQGVQWRRVVYRQTLTDMRRLHYRCRPAYAPRTARIYACGKKSISARCSREWESLCPGDGSNQVWSPRRPLCRSRRPAGSKVRSICLMCRSITVVDRDCERQGAYKSTTF